MVTLNEHYESLKIKITEGHSQQASRETSTLKNLISKENILNVMEIGFNGGHSAETFLSNNPNIHLTSFDIGIHDYVQIGKKFIDTHYPNRHELILGDSLITVPKYAANNIKKFDLIFVDGDHTYDAARADLMNCSKLAHKDTILVMDDVVTLEKNIKSWNIGPNKAWYELVNNKFIEEKEQQNFKKGHGIAWGKYLKIDN